jgi:tetratricopeptide (TPR) repeat protein
MAPRRSNGAARKIQTLGVMMKRAFRNIAALTWTLALGFLPLWAQKVKSEKERQAILAVQVAATPDAKIAAIENVLTNFADTEFKAALLQTAVQAEEQKNDYVQTVFYAERLLKADPMNTFALVTLAAETARHTRENDLDKDEQLAKVDKWAKDAVEAARAMPKVRTDVSDADWDGFKKDMEAQAYEAMGMAAMVRKNYDGAINSYKQALATESTPNPATMVRLAQVYMSTGKLGDATFTLDKAINTPNVPAQVKTVAESMKAEVAKHTKPAAPATPSAAPGSAAAPTSSAPPANPAPPAANQNP